MKKTIRKGISLVLVLLLLVLSPLSVNAAQTSKEFASELQSKYGMKVSFVSDYTESEKQGLLKQLDEALAQIGKNFVKEVVSVYTNNGYTAAIKLEKIMWSDTMGMFGVSNKNATIKIMTFRSADLSTEELDSQTVSHEFGHMVQYALDIKKGSSYVTKKWNACGTGVYVSDYASTSLREDFAETFAFIASSDSSQATLLDAIEKDTTGILKKKVDCMDSLLGEFKSFSTILKMYDFQGIPASNSKVRVSVNGKIIEVYLYNIKGYNYVKVRDLAMMLNGTEKQFDVSWDSGKQAIVITSGVPYAIAGGELVRPNTYINKAAQTTARVYIDDNEISPTVYNIQGYNYFKLRDIAKPLDFKVEWTTHALLVDTTTGYVE